MIALPFLIACDLLGRQGALESLGEAGSGKLRMKVCVIGFPPGEI
jgi:hypothetical protein